jgi:hypothetical protein
MSESSASDGPAPAGIPLRELLFGDVPLAEWARGEGPPWSHFAEAHRLIDAGDARKAVAPLRAVLDAPGLESRHYLQAWHALRRVGVPAPMVQARMVYGIVVEVGMPEGVDILAVYNDHSVRYINFSGAAVILDAPDAEVSKVATKLLHLCQQVVKHTAPWGQPRLPPPAAGNARMSFLTAEGIHFGQGPLDELAKDPTAGPVLVAATAIVQLLTQKAGPREPQ